MLADSSEIGFSKLTHRILFLGIQATGSGTRGG